MPAIHRLASHIRKGLGEELASIQQSEQRLEKVTTPSLRALQLYSQADALIVKYQCGQADALLQEAVQEDPEFASAHMLLAHCLSNLGKHADAAPHYQRALELAGTTTDRERYFIQASYYQRFLQAEDKGIQTLEVLQRLYPDHYWAVTNLMVAYFSRGQPREALPYVLRRADLRPNEFDHQLRAAQALLIWGDRGGTEAYLRRARALAAHGKVNPWRVAWVAMYPAQADWVRGEFAQGLREAEKVAASISAQGAMEQYAVRWYVGSFYLALGKLQAAEEIFQHMRGPSEELALVAWGLGDQQAAREHLRGAPSSHRAAILLARTGQLAEAERAIADPAAVSRAYAPFLPFLWDDLARGEMALARSRTAEAIRLLQPTLNHLRTWPTAYFFLAADSLAQAWEQQGKPLKAIEVLEVASREKSPAIFWEAAPFFWMKTQLRLAQLYRKVGRGEEARGIEAEMRKLLALADPDFPILRKLQHPKSPAVASQD